MAVKVMVIAFSFLLFPYSSTLVYARTAVGDIAALKELKDSIMPSTVPQGSCISTWDFSFDPCDSAFTSVFTCGLRCDGHRVTELTLDATGYAGIIPSSLGHLTALQDLDLSNNAFHGSVPGSIGNLVLLQRLSLSNNNLSGEIPAELGRMRSLQRLALDGNAISGTIPAEISGLGMLTHLEVGSNRLTGTLPDLSSMTHLTLLDATGNWLDGFLGSRLPVGLLQLSLRRNNFDVLPIVAELPALQVLDMSENKLTGTLSSMLFCHPALEQLTLSHNRLAAIEVPGSYGTDSALIEVDLSYNNIEGTLPLFVASMPRLSSLSLSYNKFTGSIPIQYARPGRSPLARLFLEGNYLVGAVPQSFRRIVPGDVDVSFGDNCLVECPVSLWFCQGSHQKAADRCRSFLPLSQSHG